MKKKTDDLQRLDGVPIPMWLKILITIISAVITIVLFMLFRVFWG